MRRYLLIVVATMLALPATGTAQSSDADLIAKATMAAP